jgi:hypothetical protein
MLDSIQYPVNQSVKTTYPENIEIPHSGTNQTPYLITKKWLCVRFGCYNSSGCNYKRLYTCVLTDDVLLKIGLTPDLCKSKSFKTFTAVQSNLLKNILSL